MRLAWEATAQAERGGRALLLASLALNLFFVGAAGALLVRHSLAPPAAPAVIDRSAAGRIERLLYRAATPGRAAEIEARLERMDDAWGAVAAGFGEGAQAVSTELDAYRAAAARGPPRFPGPPARRRCPAPPRRHPCRAPRRRAS